MPIISDFDRFLKEHVAVAERGYLFKVLNPMVDAQPQRGQICKLNALNTVLNWLNRTHGMPKPLKIRKDKDPAITSSLRQLAKEKYGSKVGEVYSAKTLIAIALDNGYDNSTIFTLNNKDSYLAKIVSLINAGEAPIIFYDIDVPGEPTQLDSNREHATVVVGYFINKQNELGFIVTQWGNYYWANAGDIFESTNQLSSLRTPEYFYRCNRDWHDGYSLINYHASLLQQPIQEQRVANALPLDDGGLKNKIVVIHNKPKVLPQISFWASPLTPSPMKLTANESEKLLREDLRQWGIPLLNP